MKPGLDPQPAGSVTGRHPKATLVAVLGVGVLASWGLQLAPPPAQKLTLTPVVQAVLSDRGSPRVGAHDPDVTIVVFTDYLCAVCRGADSALDRARADDPKAQVIYKDWPLFGERSRYAARVALAADRQGRYLQVHNALMRTRRSLDAQAVEDVATAAGADWKRIQADLLGHRSEIDSQLSRHASEAWSLGIEGTPAYMVGSLLVKGPMGADDLRHAIGKARKSATPTRLTAAG